MFKVAILIGIYGYAIWLLGVIGLLNKTAIGLVTVLWLVVLISRFKLPKLKKPSAFVGFILALIILQAAINLVGVLGPELGFDSLWYHLTLPKIFLAESRIFYIPGGLFYYSVIPKLTEMLYLAALSLGNEIWAKLIHFGFGILTLIALFKLSRKFLSQKYALLVVLLFYSNLVVGWQSITAYVDLSRTFYQVMAFWAFTKFLDNKDKKWLSISGVMLGLEISTKIVGFDSLLLFIILILITAKKSFKNLPTLIVPALLVPAPWFIFSWAHTGNPVYPVFSRMPLNYSINPIDIIRVFLRSPDPLSPLYEMFLPLIIYYWRPLIKKYRLLIWYGILALLIWFITPRDNGGRFILPYLPVISLLIVCLLSLVKDRFIRNAGIVFILLAAVVSIGYRGMANAKYLPVLLGRQSKADFMAKNLNFTFGDYYDVDGKIKAIVGNKKVLIIGGHNLFYLNFPFVHESYAKTNEQFSFILTQNASLPASFRQWKFIYGNELTKVKLYSQ